MNIKKGPWTVINSKIVYKNPWITVREDRVIRPDNEEGIFGVMEMKPGVSILPLDDENNVYLTQEYHYAVERVTIEAISGGIDDKENKFETARRELKEETGILADEWTDLGVVDPFTTVVNSPNYMLLARRLTFIKAKPEGTENIKVIKVPLAKAIKWVMKSKITHAATSTLILKVKNLLNV